jgi:hypothetical protein
MFECAFFACIVAWSMRNLHCTFVERKPGVISNSILKIYTEEFLVIR